MLKNFIYISFLSSFFWSCNEIGPAIDLTPTNTALLDTTYNDANLPTNVHRRVLLEEFTGQKCVNCPQGHVVSKAILNAHPDSVLVTALHNFEVHPPASWVSLENQDAFSLNTYLGPADAWPAATINRKSFGTIIQTSTSSWAGLVQSELALSTVAEIYITNTPDIANAKLKTKVKVHFYDQASTSLKLSVWLQEDEIEAPQTTPSGEVENYIHEFVLRDMFTPYNGVTLSNLFSPGVVYEKEFEMDINNSWSLANCKVVAILHEDSSTKIIHQAQWQSVQ